LSSEFHSSRSPVQPAIDRGHRDWSWLNTTIARRTTDLLCIAIVAGGLLTAVSNLWPDTPSELSNSINAAPREVFAADVPVDADQLSAIQWRSIAGDELAAWNALIEELRPAARSDSSVNLPIEDQSTDDLASWPLVLANADEQWSIRRPPDIPRMAVAVSERRGDPLICAWGLIRSSGEESWSVAVVRSP
jgi:hypothetical protein